MTRKVYEKLATQLIAEMLRKQLKSLLESDTPIDAKIDFYRRENYTLYKLDLPRYLKTVPE
jgi:hypothetical protein